MIVADANLILYRYVVGQLTPLADAARGKDADWRTTALWRVEFTSALVKMIRARVLDEPAALAAMSAAAADMTPREVDVPQERALRAAVRCGISAYDAQYVALAEILGVPCVTADATMARKTVGVTVLLSDFVK